MLGVHGSYGRLAWAGRGPICHSFKSALSGGNGALGNGCSYTRASGHLRGPLSESGTSPAVARNRALPDLVYDSAFHKHNSHIRELLA